MNESQTRTNQQYQDNENKLRARIALLEADNAALGNLVQHAEKQIATQEEELDAMCEQINYWRKRVHHWMMKARANGV